MSDPYKMISTGNEAMLCGALIGSLEIIDDRILKESPFLFGAGYPITPVNEAVYFGMRYFSGLNASFIQAESELAAANMLIGAAAMGIPSFTATSSPGISLMQEAISYAAGMELGGLVIADIVRGGPGLGNIQGAQSDLYQAVLGGGHGDYRLIVLAPSSVQEMFDFTRRAFALSSKYNTPALILADGYLGQLKEYYSFDGILKKENRLRVRTDVRTSYYPGEDVLAAHNWKLKKMFDSAGSDKALAGDAIDYYPSDEPADVLVLAYGSYARCGRGVVDRLRDEGSSVSLGTMKVLSPFPGEALRQAASRHRAFLVLEGSHGQLHGLVEKEVGSDIFIGRASYPGGVLPQEKPVCNYIRSLIEKLSDGYDQARKAVADNLSFIEKNFNDLEYTDNRNFDVLAPDDRTMDFEIKQKPVNKNHKADNQKNHFAAFCPGCSNHAIVHTVRDVLTELTDFRPILYSPVGCTVKLYEYFDDDKYDNIQVPHGRGPAAAAASRRTCPGRPVIVVQGDGDALTIGGNELLHAIERGDQITIVILNNGLFGMTGGQASSSTPTGSFSSTTVGGRNPDQFGHPLDLFQLASHPGVSYFRRLLMNDKGEIEEFGTCLTNAVAHQMKGTGLGIIEILCACPSRQKLETDEKMSKVKASRIYSEEVLAGAFPINKRTGDDFKDPMRVIRESCLKKTDSMNHSREAVLDKCLNFFKGSYSLNSQTAELSDRELTLVLSGRGGQGIQTIAELLFRIWTPVFPGSSLMPWYTPEVRNATTSATLKICRERGTNPDAQTGKIDALLCMSQDGIEKYKGRLSEESGLLIYDPEGCSFDPEMENLSDNITVIGIPATAISRKEFGNPLYSNMILAGFLLKNLAVFTDESAVPAYMEKIFSGFPANLKAFLIGYNSDQNEN